MVDPVFFLADTFWQRVFARYSDRDVYNVPCFSVGDSFISAALEFLRDTHQVLDFVVSR